MRLKRNRTQISIVDPALATIDPQGFLGKQPSTLRTKAKAKVGRIKPRGGFSVLLHSLLTILMPFAVYTLVRVEFAQLAIVLVLLSKWRMFAVKARHWPAHIRANAVDIIVGISAVLFMTKTHSQSMQFAWAVLYGVWLVVVKPRSTTVWVGVQAMIGQFAGLAALYSSFGSADTSVLVIVTALICYLSARHFFTAFDETMGRTTAYVWAYFGASVAWLLSHWLLFYGVMAQPVLILVVVGYALAALYYFDHMGKLSKNIQRQFIAVLTAILLFLIVFSDWRDKTT